MIKNGATKHEWQLTIHRRWDEWLYGKGKEAFEQVGDYSIQSNPTVDKPVFFAGPWIGEFGWELSCWQGGIRELVHSLFGTHHVIVMGDPGHNVLYEYADEYWDVPEFFLNAGLTRQCAHVRGKKAPLYLSALGYAVAVELKKYSNVLKVVPPRRFRPEVQEYIQLGGKNNTKRSSFCYFPRNRRWWKEKNWPFWDELIPLVEEETELNSVGITADWDLSDSIEMLRASHFAISPESGAIFLSFLCGIPTIAFGHEQQEKRLSKANVFGVPFVYNSRTDHNHSVEEVFYGIKELLRAL